MTWLTRADKLKKMNRYVDNLMKLGCEGKNPRLTREDVSLARQKAQNSSMTFRAACP